MIGRRLLACVYLLGSLLLLGTSLHAPTAYSAPGDPPRGSPAGAVYQLPLQQGRADAAPKGGGGGGSNGSGAGGASGIGSGSQGEAGSLYRTENDFGSSSRVPGLAVAGTAVAGDRGDGGAAGGLRTGGGSGGGIAGGGAIAGGAIAGQVSDAGNTSVPAAIGLLGAIVLLAGGVAMLSRRYLQRRGP